MGSSMNKLFLLILSSVILFFGYGFYEHFKTTQSKKEKRVPCQQKTITFEKISNKSLIATSINLLQTNNYEIVSKIELSQHMKSKILKYISVERANELLIKTIDNYTLKENPSEKKLLIDYYIYENDKEDKGKKSKKAKLYAGYLVFKFKLDKKLIYQIQTDFMKMDTSDIENRMECVIKSFITLNNSTF